MVSARGWEVTLLDQRHEGFYAVGGLEERPPSKHIKALPKRPANRCARYLPNISGCVCAALPIAALAAGAAYKDIKAAIAVVACDAPKLSRAVRTESHCVDPTSGSECVRMRCLQAVKTPTRVLAVWFAGKAMHHKSSVLRA